MEDAVTLANNFAKQLSEQKGVILGTAAALAVVYAYANDTKLNPKDLENLKKANGGDIVAKTLKAHGVKTIFGLSGGHVSPIFVGCEKLGIQVLDVRHEGNAAFAADAHARLSGNVGVAVVTAGPGVTNTITPLKNAQMAQSPLLLIGGAPPMLLKGKGALQDIDTIVVVKPLCKYVKSVTQVSEIEREVCKAIQIAKSGTPGPVFLEMPLDTLWPHQLMEKEVKAMANVKGFVGKIISWYVDRHLKQTYMNMPSMDTPVKLLPPVVPKATTNDVHQVSEWFVNAEKPVFVLASQSTLNPSLLDDIVKNITELHVPTYVSGMARGLLGPTHPVMFKHTRKYALKNSDCVILLGVSDDFRVGYGKSFPRSPAKVVMVNRCKAEATKNVGSMWQPSKVLIADPADFFLSMCKQAKSQAGRHRSSREQFVSELRQMDSAKDQLNYKKSTIDTETHLNPLRFLYYVNEVMPKDAIMVGDGGDFVGSAAYILQARGPLAWLDPGAFGTLGVGGGFALAAANLNKDREVWLIWGDGSCGFTLTEIDTMCRFGLPVICIIGNDAAWTQIKRAQVEGLNSPVACELVYTSYEKAAVGLGAAGGYLLDRVDGESVEDEKARIISVLEEARATARREMKPVLVNCLIGSTDFRKDSISI